MEGCNISIVNFGLLIVNSNFLDLVVLNVFSLSSQQVLKVFSQQVSQVPSVFLNMFPIASHFIPYPLL
jgi:hypothetical protein